jgi:hypothetical protein
MKRKVMILVMLLGLFILSGGCSSKRSISTDAPAAIPSASKLQTHPEDKRSLIYVNPNAPKKNYTKFIIEPIHIYQGEDHGFGNIPMEDRRMIADFIPKELTRVIGEKYAVLDKPGPNTMRIKLVLVGLEKTNTVMRGLMYGNPVGLVVNLTKGAVGKEGYYMGSITLAGEFEDSETGTVLSAFIGKIHPFAMDLSFAPWAAAKAGVTKFAMDFRDRIDKKQQIEK